VTVSVLPTTSVIEGDAPVVVPIPVTISQATAEAAVPFTVTAGSASTADYTVLTPNSLVFGAGGARTKNIEVEITGDALDEAKETFVVRLGTPSGQGAVLGRARNVVTIVDNDNAPSLQINDASVAEGNSGTRNLTFPVTLGRASAKTVTVRWATANGSARAPSDYVSASGTLTFAPGQTVQNVVVKVRGDQQREPSETMLVTLFGATNAGIGDPNGTGVIRSDD